MEIEAEYDLGGLLMKDIDCFVRGIAAAQFQIDGSRTMWSVGWMKIYHDGADTDQKTPTSISIQLVRPRKRNPVRYASRSFYFEIEHVIRLPEHDRGNDRCFEVRNILFTLRTYIPMDQPTVTLTA